jgi:hypothetical protein
VGWGRCRSATLSRKCKKRALARGAWRG